MHNLIAAIAATPQPDTALETGVTSSDEGSFRDVLRAKVVDQSRTPEMRCETNKDVANTGVQSGVTSGEKLSNQYSATARSRYSGKQDKNDPINATSLSVKAPSPPLFTPDQAAFPVPSRNVAVPGRVAVPGTAGNGSDPESAAISMTPRLTSASPEPTLDSTISSAALPGATLTPTQVMDPSQSQSQAVTGEVDPAPAESQAIAFSDAGSMATAAPFLSTGVAPSGNVQSVPNALPHPMAGRQHTDGDNRSSRSDSALTAVAANLTDGFPLQNQLAGSEGADSENTSLGIPGPPGITSAPQEESVANVVLETRAIPDTSGTSARNPNRNAVLVESGQSDRKEGAVATRSTQPSTTTQPQSPASPLNAGDLTPRTEAVQVAAALVGHGPNPDRTAVVAASAPETTHSSPSEQRPADARIHAPLPSPSVWDTADMASTAQQSMLQSTRVLERIGLSEIRVGLNTANFGDLELHTSLNQDRVAATVATNHSELRAALTAEMPSLEHAMAQHQLTLDSFHLDGRSGAQDKNHGASGEQQNGQTWNQAAFTPSDGSPALEPTQSQAWIQPHSSGLNVHA